MTRVKFINNSQDNYIYDTTIQITKNNKTMFIDVQFDREHNRRLGLDATQFENDIIDMLKFVSDEDLTIE